MCDQAIKIWLVQAAGPAGLRFSIMPKAGVEAALPPAAVGIPVREELGGASLAALLAAIPFYVAVRFALTSSMSSSLNFLLHT